MKAQHLQRSAELVVARCRHHHAMSTLASWRRSHLHLSVSFERQQASFGFSLVLVFIHTAFCDGKPPPPLLVLTRNLLDDVPFIVIVTLIRSPNYPSTYGSRSVELGLTSDPVEKCAIPVQTFWVFFLGGGVFGTMSK